MKQNVLVTGGASGLGLAIAKQYLSQGANVCIGDINQQYMQSAREALSAYSDQVTFSVCDITDEASIEQLRATLSEQWKQLDVLVNNAGVATGGKLEFEDIETWQWVLNINLLGLVRMTKAFVPMLTRSPEQPNSCIINIASQAGITPIPAMGSYNASKSAVVSFSETMNLELGGQGIHVSVACPSFFATNLDKSLRTNMPGLDKTVTKLLNRSDLTADQVAAIIVESAAQKKFMLLTHKEGKRAYYLKRFLPTSKYLNIVRKQTAKLLGSGREQ